MYNPIKQNGRRAIFLTENQTRQIIGAIRQNSATLFITWRNCLKNHACIYQIQTKCIKEGLQAPADTVQITHEAMHDTLKPKQLKGNFIIYTCAFPTVAYQNVSCEKALLVEK